MYMQKAHTHTHTQTTSTTAEQEAMGINRKYLKMVAEAFFFSFFMKLNDIYMNKPACTKLLFTLSPHALLLHSSFLRYCRNMLTKCTVTFPKAKKSLNINTFFFKLSGFIWVSSLLLWNVLRCLYSQAKLWWIIDWWQLHQSAVLYTYLAFLNTEFTENRR